MRSLDRLREVFEKVYPRVFLNKPKILYGKYVAEGPEWELIEQYQKSFELFLEGVQEGQNIAYSTVGIYS